MRDNYRRKRSVYRFQTVFRPPVVRTYPRRRSAPSNYFYAVFIRPRPRNIRHRHVCGPLGADPEQSQNRRFRTHARPPVFGFSRNAANILRKLYFSTHPRFELSSKFAEFHRVSRAQIIRLRKQIDERSLRETTTTPSLTSRFDGGRKTGRNHRKITVFIIISITKSIMFTVRVGGRFCGARGRLVFRAPKTILRRNMCLTLLIVIFKLDAR